MGKTDGFPMIPRILHYVWLGGKPLNELGERCLASWQKHLPGWQIKRWDETNSPMEHPYVKAMMKRGLVAFASDYVRLHALSKEGGIYFDTDMELIGDIQPLLQRPVVTSFISMQEKVTKNYVGMGFLAAIPDHPWIRDFLRFYDRRTKTPVAADSMKLLWPYGFRRLKKMPSNEEFYDFGEFRVYHSDYFYPASSESGGYRISPRTLAVHHSTNNWGNQADPLPWYHQIKDLRIDRKIIRPVEQAIKRLLGRKKSA